jgi:YVTN family beta-propeller protein
VVLNNAGTKLYVLNRLANALLVVDTVANSLAATIPLPVGTNAVAESVNPSGTRIYVTGAAGSSQNTNGTLSVIDAATNTVMATLATGVDPGLPQVNHAGTSVYVTNAGSNSVSVFDVASNTLVATIAVPPIGAFPYMSSFKFNSFAVIGPNVHIGASATGSGTITAAFSDGGAGFSYLNPQFIGPPPGATPVPPVAPPSGVTFPHGLFNFSVTGCTPGATLSFIVTYPSPLDPATQYWKYGPTPDDSSPHWYVLPAIISGNTATFTIVDGGLGDDDLTANGTVVDQGGPGVPAPPAQPQPGSPGGGGCASINTRGPTDPTLPAMTLLALWLILKRRRAALRIRATR